MDEITAWPETTQALLAKRKSMRQRTLNDHVEDLHVALWSEPEYRKALEAVYDEDAIEGSLACDNVVAAGMLRERAKKDSNFHVQDKKLATIVKALNVVLARYEMTRQQRRNMIGGQTVRSPGNAD